jgi:pimeloyl-ACP methyl ester carboxylesterase
MRKVDSHPMFSHRVSPWLWCCLLFFSGASLADYDPDGPMSRTTNGELEIAYRVVGDSEAEPILIIMGLSASHKVWNPEIIQGLVDGGYRVVLLDNRDVGESSRIPTKGRLWLGWQLLKYQFGWSVKSIYPLTAMADDAVAVLDALDIQRAHVIGASMGGMIAQIVAYDYPQRTQSLGFHYVHHLGTSPTTARSGSAGYAVRYE